MSLLLEVSGAAVGRDDGATPAGSYDPNRQMWNAVAHSQSLNELLDVYRHFNTTGCGSTGNVSGDADPDD